MIPAARLQHIIVNKDADQAIKWCQAFDYVEGWAICDGALVIYNVDNPPAWFDFPRDEDGNSISEETHCGCATADECHSIDAGWKCALATGQPLSSGSDPFDSVLGPLTDNVSFGGSEGVEEETVEANITIINNFYAKPDEEQQLEYECCEECG